MDGLLLMDIKLWYACSSKISLEKEDTEDRCLIPARDMLSSPQRLDRLCGLYVMGAGNTAAGLWNSGFIFHLRLHDMVLSQAEEKFAFIY
jgi:hypothetical protein